VKLDKDGYPTSCHLCGQPIVKRKGGSVHEYDHATATALSWHLECRYPKIPAATT
jgi:hypothetical protein